jgi:hypothetical protein
MCIVIERSIQGRPNTQNQMRLFKENDILEYDGRDNRSAKKGAKAIFKEYYKEYIKVEWIRDELSGTQRNGGYYARNFTKLEEQIKE